MKKGFMKKMAIVCLFLVVFNFVGTNVVYAKAADGWGGKLMSVFMEFIVGAADGVYNITNGLIMGDELFEIHGIIPLDTNKKTNNSTWDNIKNIAGFVIGWASGFNIIVGTGKFIWDVLGPTQEEKILGQTYAETGEDGKKVVYTLYDKDDLPSIIYLPIFNLDLASMFSGKILLFDVNFFENKEIKEQIFEGKKIYYYTDRDAKKGENEEYDPSYSGNYITSSQSSSQILRGVVSSWYYRLRNLAVAVSMIVLLYIGIRILLSSVNPESKAKYKTLL
ncbi:MAG: hypothetical protein IJV31_08240, partial [Clostridia bacterium]|nr:hypothetical protein [Clostridia bacterium]